MVRAAVEKGCPGSTGGCRARRSISRKFLGPGNMNEGEMFRSLGDLIRLARQRQDDPRPQHQGLIGMADVVGPSVGGDEAERQKRPTAQEVRQVLRVHPS